MLLVYAVTLMELLNAAQMYRNVNGKQTCS